MEIVTLPATTKGPAAMFAGDVWFDVIAPPQAEPSQMKVNVVRFSPAPIRPGIRTRWVRRFTSPKESATCSLAAVNW